MNLKNLKTINYTLFAEDMSSQTEDLQYFSAKSTQSREDDDKEEERDSAKDSESPEDNNETIMTAKSSENLVFMSKMTESNMLAYILGTNI